MKCESYTVNNVVKFMYDSYTDVGSNLEPPSHLDEGTYPLGTDSPEKLPRQLYQDEDLTTGSLDN